MRWGGPGRVPPEPLPARAFVEPTLCFLLAAAAVALTLHHMAGDSATSDEPVHIASGFEIVRQGTGRWNPEHPPLAKALSGLALAGMDLEPPANPLGHSSRAQALVRFVHENKVRSERLLFRARLPFVAILVALLFALRREARRRFGDAARPHAGLIALGLGAFEPNLLAHAGVVHTDLLVTLFLVLSLGPLARLAESGAGRPWRPAASLGIFWGLAFLSKFSAPLLSLASLTTLFANDAPWTGARLRRVALGLLGASGVAALVVLAGYAISHRNQTAEDREALSTDRLLAKGRSEEAHAFALALGKASPPASNAAIGALSIVLQSRVGAGVNYFMGRVSKEGSPFYFPVALATKISCSLAVAAVLGLLIGGKPERRHALTLLAALAVFTLFSSRTTYNIGVRHMLFAFPFLALAAAGGITQTRRPLRLTLCALIPLQGLEVFAVHPHELSFFNVWAGGPAGGRRFFVDSNLDWGQDLLRLARLAPELTREPLPTVFFGGDLPARHAPALRQATPADAFRNGGLIAFGEQPLAIGEEFYAARGNLADAEGLRVLRDAVRSRGTRVAAVGGSIAVFKLGNPSPDPARTSATPRRPASS